MSSPEYNLSQAAELDPFPYSSDLIKRYLVNIYPNLNFVDGKSNPFNALASSDSIVFKTLPIDAESNLIKSIQNDIKLISKKNSPYRSIIYISTDNRFLDISYKADFLSKVKKSFSLDIIPYSIIKRSSFLNLNSSELLDIISLNKYNESSDKYKRNIPIITRIFEYVTTLPEYNSYPSVPDTGHLLRLEEKIKANFWGDLQNDVKTDFLFLWQTKMVVECFIKMFLNQYRWQFNCIKSRVFNSYLQIPGIEFSNDEVSNISVFNTITNSIIPPDLKDDQDAFDCSKALVYYFFEYCLFGRKTKYDNPTFEFSED